MAINVESVRTPAMRARRYAMSGFYPDDACHLCGKILKPGYDFVAINHESGEFVSETEAVKMGDAVSGFPIGADCALRVKRALRCA